MIDIDCCRDVIISDCFADTDDDALTLKSTADRPTENVAVTNCLLSSHCNAIKMGTESNGGFKNITITNCAISPSRAPSVIAGRKGGLAGIALEIVDGGTLDGITISNVTTIGGTAPIFLRLGNRARVFKPDSPKPSIGTFRNVVISNVVATGAGATGCSITGLPEHPIENVTLSNIKITTIGGGTKQDAARSIPELPTKYPESTMFGTLPAYGFFCRHVDGLTLRHVDLRFSTPDHRPALICDDVRSLSLESLSAQTTPDAPAQIVLNNTRYGFVRGCCPPETAAVFLRLQGGSDHLNVVANDLSRVRNPFALDDSVLRSALYTAANRATK
jgi:polygalacturonase